MTHDEVVEVLSRALIASLVNPGPYQRSTFRAEIICLNGERFVGISPLKPRETARLPLKMLFGLSSNAWRQFDSSDEVGQAKLLNLLQASLPVKLNQVSGLTEEKSDRDKHSQTDAPPPYVRFESFD